MSKPTYKRGPFYTYTDGFRHEFERIGDYRNPSRSTLRKAKLNPYQVAMLADAVGNHNETR